MKRSLRLIILGHLLLAISCITLAQVIPTNRRVDWSLSLKSYNYLVPVREINVKEFGALGDGVNDDHPAIMEAISSLNGQLGAIYFPSGIYLIKNSVSLPDSVILRGPGADDTELQFDLKGSNKNCISIGKPQTSITISVDGGYTKGSNILYADSATQFDIGDYVIISQQNGDWDDNPISWADNTVGQVVQIINVIGDELYLDSPLRITYQEELNPVLKSITVTANSGISCLKIKRIDKPETGGGANIFIRHAVNCFVRGVESDTSAGSHIDIFSSKNILIDGCYIHHAFEYNGASKHGYGITLNNQTSECLITNNIFEKLRHAMMVKTGANGNVFSYNFSGEVFRSEWPNTYAGDISLHGHFVYANLFEGNVVQNIFIDHYWGPSGPLNTFFRNRAELFGIIITSGNPTTSNRQNFVGNEITNTGFFYGNYDLTGTDHFEFGNNRNGTTIPEGTDTLNDMSYYMTNQPSFWTISDNWPSIGIPNDIGTGNIPAKVRYEQGDDLIICPDSVLTRIPKVDKEELGFNLRPNPATTKVIISISGSFKGAKEICILSTKGQIIHKTETEKDEIALNLDMVRSSGIYIVKLKAGEWVQMEKLMVFK